MAPIRRIFGSEIVNDVSDDKLFLFLGHQLPISIFTFRVLAGSS